MEKTKVCSKCGEKLVLDKFTKSNKWKDGHVVECKECHNKRSKAYYRANKESIAGKIKQWQLDNKEIVQERGRKYYLANREKVTKRNDEYRQNNREARLEYAKNFRQVNKESIAARESKWRKEHKDMVNTWTNQNRSRKRLLPAALTPVQWETIKHHFNNTCCYCGKENPLEQEHFIPVTSSGAYDINNIIPSCRSCNASKNNKPFETWYSKHKYYSKKREKIILDFLNYKQNNQQLSISL